MRNLFRWAIGSTCGCAVVALHTFAQAQDLPPGRRTTRIAPANNCAVYGPGFVPVAGSDTCIKLSGHVRVEYGWGNPPARGNSGYGNSNYADPPASGGFDGGPGHASVYGRLRPDSEIGFGARAPLAGPRRR